MLGVKCNFMEIILLQIYFKIGSAMYQFEVSLTVCVCVCA